MSKTSLTMLGTCAVQTPRFETTSFLVETEDERVLFECGPGIVRQLQLTKKGLSPLDAVVITHSHADHSAGFSYLVFSLSTARRQLGGEPKPLTVVSTETVWNDLRVLLAMHYPPGEFSNVPLVWSPLAEDSASCVGLDGLRLRSIPVEHQVSNVGIRVDTAQCSITYSSDTVLNDGLVQLATGSDLLIHEAFCTRELASVAAAAKHSTAEDAGRAASRSGAKAMFLVHALPQYFDGDDRLVKEAESQCDIQATLPDVLTPFEW